MVDFKSGSRGMMKTIERYGDSEVDGAVRETFAGHNVNITCPASASSKFILMPSLMLGARADGIGIACDARTTP
jgi:hypothetical protein